MKANVSISKPTGGDGIPSIAIDIGDTASHLTIVRVEIGLKEFAEALTGLAFCDAEITHIVNASYIDKLGKIKETKSIFVKKAFMDESEQKRLVKEAIPEGWELWSDGCSSQQHGEQHKAIVCRYVAAQEEGIK